MTDSDLIIELLKTIEYHLRTIAQQYCSHEWALDGKGGFAYFVHEDDPSEEKQYWCTKCGLTKGAKQ